MHKNLGRPLLLSGTALLLVLLTPNQAWAYSSTQTKNLTSSGQDWTFTFSSLPTCVSGSVSVGLTLYGDYNYNTEYADVFIDSASQGQFPGLFPL